MILKYCGFLMLLALIASCGSDKKGKDVELIKPTETTEYDCINLKGLSGKRFLDQASLKAIDNIKTNVVLSNDLSGMVLIEGGMFNMGGDIPEGYTEMSSTMLPQEDEFPKHEVEVSSFYMDEHEVTVGDFKAFIDATGYMTTAERQIDWEEMKKQLPEGTPRPEESLMKPGALVFNYPDISAGRDNLANWWSYMPGARWSDPRAENVNIEDILEQPVTQVSWYDALAYARWVGKRLPTEAEYEYAMRAGKVNHMYPWGGEGAESGHFKGNFLQGNFPYVNLSLDGYEFASPVKSFPPNAYGLYDIAGNVWEWTMDWYSPSYYAELKDQKEVSVNPPGPAKSREYSNPYATSKVVRGGSFLCNDSWCSGFRNARRMRLSPDSGLQHIGFRLVRDAT